MKSTAPELTPILRSETQGRMLAELLLDPQAEFTLTALAKRTGVALPTILRDIDRLVQGGYLTDRRVGRARLVRAHTSHPLFEPLRTIVMYGYGPPAVLSRLLADVARIDNAYIYGSWAERASGQPGHDPGDVDVLVVGQADQSALYEVSRRASQEIGKEVTVNQVSRKRWESANDGFITTVRSRALIPIEVSGQ